jgi:hypothetical protein
MKTLLEIFFPEDYTNQPIEEPNMKQYKVIFKSNFDAARKDNETRLEFVARVAAMMLRGGEQTMWAGDEFFMAEDVANELEQLAWQLNQ